MEFLDLNTPEGAREYLSMWDEAGLLDFEEGGVQDLDDEEAMSVAKQIFLKGDDQMPTMVVQ